jgi:hypothetical protein
VTDSNTVAPMNDAPPSEERMPRGILVVIAVGLLACVVAALLATDKGGGSAADVEWVQRKPLPDSKAVEVPGGGGKMQLTDAGIRATGSNASGYELFRVLSILRIDAGAPVGSARIVCEMKTPAEAEVGHTPNQRASYPRSSEELFDQEMSETVLVDFSSHGAELAVLEVEDLPERWATEKGIKLEWPEYDPKQEQWNWFLPSGPPSEELVLPFMAVWKTTGVPVARVSCELTTSAGTASVATAGALEAHSAPIAE